MTQKIIYYLVLALLFVAVPMALAWLPVRMMVGILTVIQLLTLIIVGAVIQDLKPRKDHEQE
jgi:hypothetical protein